MFVLILANSNFKVFLALSFQLKKKLFHVLNIYLIYVMNTIFKNINDFHKSGLESDFPKKNLPSFETNLMLLIFFLTRTTQNQSKTTKYSSVEQK